MAKLQSENRESTYTRIATQGEKTDPTEPEWVTKLAQWGTEQEIRQLDNAYKRRTERQQEIPRPDKKSTSLRDASDFGRFYKHGDKQDTQKSISRKFSMPESQSLT